MNTRRVPLDQTSVKERPPLNRRRHLSCPLERVEVDVLQRTCSLTSETAVQQGDVSQSRLEGLDLVRFQIFYMIVLTLTC